MYKEVKNLYSSRIELPKSEAIVKVKNSSACKLYRKTGLLKETRSINSSGRPKSKSLTIEEK